MISEGLQVLTWGPSSMEKARRACHGGGHESVEILSCDPGCGTRHPHALGHPQGPSPDRRQANAAAPAGHGRADGELAGFDGSVLILYGDTPFVTEATLGRMLDRLAQPDDPGVVVLASSPADGKTYGRVILGEGDHISKMVEFKDANEAERAVK